MAEERQSRVGRLWGMVVNACRLRRLREAPIFIIGCGRSGTTLLVSILSADPALYCVPEETESFKGAEQDGPLRLFLRKLKMASFLVRAPLRISGHRCWVEKTPIHVRTVQQIRKAYRGHVRFIHIIRDGRDVVTSRHPTRSRGFHIHKERWVRDVSAGLSHRNDPDVVTIRYEDLVSRFDETVGRIYSFLGRPVPGSVRDFSSNATIRSHYAWPGEIRDLYTSSIGRWKDPGLAEVVAGLLSLPEAVRLLRELGYMEPPADASSPAAST